VGDLRSCRVAATASTATFRRAFTVSSTLITDAVASSTNSTFTLTLARIASSVASSTQTLLTASNIASYLRQYPRSTVGRKVWPFPFSPCVRPKPVEPVLLGIRILWRRLQGSEPSSVFEWQCLRTPSITTSGSTTAPAAFAAAGTATPNLSWSVAAATLSTLLVAIPTPCADAPSSKVRWLCGSDTGSRWQWLDQR
jgi:hypothetical protein